MSTDTGWPSGSSWGPEQLKSLRFYPEPEKRPWADLTFDALFDDDLDQNVKSLDSYLKESPAGKTLQRDIAHYMVAPKAEASEESRRETRSQNIVLIDTSSISGSGSSQDQNLDSPGGLPEHDGHNIRG